MTSPYTWESLIFGRDLPLQKWHEWQSAYPAIFSMRALESFISDVPQNGVTSLWSWETTLIIYSRSFGFAWDRSKSPKGLTWNTFFPAVMVFVVVMVETWSYHEVQAGLELRTIFLPQPSGYWVLGLQAHTTTPSLLMILFITLFIQLGLSFFIALNIWPGFLSIVRLLRWLHQNLPLEFNFFCTRNWTLDFALSRQALCCWAVSPAPRIQIFQ